MTITSASRYVLNLTGNGERGERGGQARFDRIAGAMEHQPSPQIGLRIQRLLVPVAMLDIPQIMKFRDEVT